MRAKKARIGIVGNPGSFGAREHTIYQVAVKSDYFDQVLCFPGNGGIPERDRVRLGIGDLKEWCGEVVRYAKLNKLHALFVGPETPLAAGIADMAARQNIPILGCTAEMAKLESSKAYTIELCEKLGVPIPPSWIARSREEAWDIIQRQGVPIVVKVDGLAAGKGVRVCETLAEAYAAIEELRNEHKTAADLFVLQEKLIGKEMSFFALCDGTRIRLLNTACDYKQRFRSGHNGHNPNTGGMGAYSSTHLADDELYEEVLTHIFEPVVEATGYRGILYAGVMLVNGGYRKQKPYLLEFNVRFGDPEAQVVLTRYRPRELMRYFAALTQEGGLEELPQLIRPIRNAAVCVNLVQKPYPGICASTCPVDGVVYEKLTHKHSGLLLFHAGTERDAKGLFACGGRVFSLVAVESTIPKAHAKVYASRAKLFATEDSRPDIAANMI